MVLPPPPRHWALAFEVVKAGPRVSKSADHRAGEQSERAIGFMGLSSAVEICTDSGVESDCGSTEGLQ